MAELWILGLVGAAVLSLAWVFHRRNRRQQALSGFSADIRPLFDELVEGWSAAGQPRLVGRFGARRLEVEVVHDRAGSGNTFLAVTLCDALPIEGSFGAVMRALGQERHLPSTYYPLRLKRPECLPGGVVLRACSPQVMPAVGKALPAMADLLSDASVKEVCVTPEGARVLCHFTARREGGRRVASRFGLPLPVLTMDRLLPLHDGLADIVDALRPVRVPTRPAPSGARSRPR